MRRIVTPKLAALRSYEHTLEAPTPPPQSYDGEAAARGRTIFDKSCAGCHVGIRGTDNNSGKPHQPAETGMDPHYDRVLKLGLSAGQEQGLTEFLKSW